MIKNTAGQKVGCQMINASDGSAFTGAVTVEVTIDAGTQATGTVGSGACTHEGNGLHTYAPSQAETNGALLEFTFHGAGAIPDTVHIYTTGYDKTLANVPANVTQLLGTAWLTPVVAGTPDVNTKLLGNTAQTGRDIGASVLLSNGTGTGQLKLASGYVAITWADVAAPTTAVDLSNTTIKTTQKVDVDTIKTNPVVNGGTITFPSNKTLAATDNITAGTITTVTNLTNLPSIPANWLTAAGTAADFGAEIATAIWTDIVAGDFTVAASIGKSIMNGVSLGTGLTVARCTLVDTLTTYTGNTPQTGDSFARIGANGVSLSAIPDLAGVTTLLARLTATRAGYLDNLSAGAVALASALATVQSDTDDIQSRLPAALVGGRIDASVGAMAANVLTTAAINDGAITAAKLAADSITAAKLAADVATELQSGLATSGAVDSAITNNASIIAIKNDTDVTIPGLIATLNDLSAAEVNNEVVDALSVDTYAQPGQEAPAATQTLAKMLAYTYKAWRNRSTQTSSEYALFADDTTTKDQKATVSDDGSTFVRGEIGTGA